MGGRGRELAVLRRTKKSKDRKQRGTSLPCVSECVSSAMGRKDHQ